MRPLVLVPSPGGPDLAPVREPDEHCLALQPDLSPELLGDHDPALSVQVDPLRVAEEHPGPRPRLPSGQPGRAELLAAAVPFVLGERVQAAVLTQRQEKALAKRLAEFPG